MADEITREAWGLMLFNFDGSGGFLSPYTYYTRSEVIDAYNALYREPNTYAKHRRKGRALAVRVLIAAQQDKED